MQRNAYRSECIDCKRLVEERQGFLYHPGMGNYVVCGPCAYIGYGHYRGLFAPLSPPDNT
ncbi:hypothetical protein [Nocardia xishanensis]